MGIVSVYVTVTWQQHSRQTSTLSTQQTEVSAPVPSWTSNQVRHLVDLEGRTWLTTPTGTVREGAGGLTQDPTGTWRATIALPGAPWSRDERGAAKAEAILRAPTAMRGVTICNHTPYQAQPLPSVRINHRGRLTLTTSKRDQEPTIGYRVLLLACWEDALAISRDLGGDAWCLPDVTTYPALTLQARPVDRTALADALRAEGRVLAAARGAHTGNRDAIRALANALIGDGQTLP